MLPRVRVVYYQHPWLCQFYWHCYYYWHWHWGWLVCGELSWIKTLGCFSVFNRVVEQLRVHWVEAMMTSLWLCACIKSREMKLGYDLICRVLVYFVSTSTSAPAFVSASLHISMLWSSKVGIIVVERSVVIAPHRIHQETIQRSKTTETSQSLLEKDR